MRMRRYGLLNILDPSAYGFGYARVQPYACVQQ